MLIGIGMAIVAAFWVLTLMAEKMVSYISFETEQQLAKQFKVAEFKPHKTAKSQAIEDYLQQLANQLAKAQQLPTSMPITVHYSENKQVNAYATLGGHIVIFSGLLEKIPNENTLAMVMAHEIAHIQNRDPVVSMGRGLAVSLALLSLLGLDDNGTSTSLISQMGELTLLGYSRTQESKADQLALQTLQAYYGHTAGAETLFEIFMQKEGRYIPAFLLTHPHTEKRLQAVKEFAKPLQVSTKPITALPNW